MTSVIPSPRCRCIQTLAGFGDTVLLFEDYSDGGLLGNQALPTLTWVRTRGNAVHRNPVPTSPHIGKIRIPWAARIGNSGSF